MILLAEALRLFRSRHGRSFALASLAVAVSACAAMASEAGMARLAGGTFLMGSDRGRPDERPAHSVTLKSFWIDRRAVTNAEFAAFLKGSAKPPMHVASTCSIGTMTTPASTRCRATGAPTRASSSIRPTR